MADSNEDLKIVFSILQFLKDKLEGPALSEEKKESLDGNCCLQTVNLTEFIRYPIAYMYNYMYSVFDVFERSV